MNSLSGSFHDAGDENCASIWQFSGPADLNSWWRLCTVPSSAPAPPNWSTLYFYFYPDCPSSCSLGLFHPVYSARMITWIFIDVYILCLMVSYEFEKESLMVDQPDAASWMSLQAVFFQVQVLVLHWSHLKSWRRAPFVIPKLRFWSNKFFYYCKLRKPRKTRG